MEYKDQQVHSFSKWHNKVGSTVNSVISRLKCDQCQSKSLRSFDGQIVLNLRFGELSFLSPSCSGPSSFPSMTSMRVLLDKHLLPSTSVPLLVEAHQPRIDADTLPPSDRVEFCHLPQCRWNYRSL